MIILFTGFLAMMVFFQDAVFLPAYNSPYIDGYTTVALTIAGIVSSVVTETIQRHTKLRNEYIYGIYIAISLVISSGVLLYSEAFTGLNMAKGMAMVVAVGYNVFRYLFNPKTAISNSTSRS